MPAQAAAMSAATTPPTTRPTSVPSAPSEGFALVTNYGGNSVGRIDLDTGNITFPYTGVSNSALNPTGVAIAPSGEFALVADYGGNNSKGEPLHLAE